MIPVLVQEAGSVIIVLYSPEMVNLDFSDALFTGEIYSVAF